MLTLLIAEDVYHQGTPVRYYYCSQRTAHSSQRTLMLHPALVVEPVSHEVGTTYTGIFCADCGVQIQEQIDGKDR